VFEWDKRKASANQDKHGVSFEEAARVFGDPDALDGPDVGHSGQESRYLRLGRAAGSHTHGGVYPQEARQMARRSVSSARAGRAARSVRPTGRRSTRIDFSDIPEASSAQLGVMRRVGRPPLGSAARRLIAIRIDPLVLAAVRREAKRRALGYQSLINQILARHVARAQSA
jgi:uncharacterized DUF497 family protein